MRETCLLTLASYVAPASEADIYNVRHVYKLTATNTTIITWGGIGLQNKTIDKFYFLNTQSIKKFTQKYFTNWIHRISMLWILENITTTCNLYFEGGTKNLEQEKTRTARHFFPVHLNRGKKRNRKIVLTFLKTRSWRIVQFALFNGTGGGSLCRRHSHRTWQVIALKGLYFSILQSKTKEILQKNVDNAKQINLRLKTGSRRQNQI